MSEHAFDAFTRQTADGMTRRRSLATLGGAGLAALLGGSSTAEAKKKKSEKKKKKSDSFKLCKPQVDQCQVSFIARGASPAIVCCDAFATCDITQFFACLVATV